MSQGRATARAAVGVRERLKRIIHVRRRATEDVAALAGDLIRGDQEGHVGIWEEGRGGPGEQDAAGRRGISVLQKVDDVEGVDMAGTQVPLKVLRHEDDPILMIVVKRAERSAWGQPRSRRGQGKVRDMFTVAEF